MRIEGTPAKRVVTVWIFACLLPGGGAIYCVGANVTLRGDLDLRNNMAEDNGGEQTPSFSDCDDAGCSNYRRHAIRVTKVVGELIRQALVFWYFGTEVCTFYCQMCLLSLPLSHSQLAMRIAHPTGGFHVRDESIAIFEGNVYATDNNAFGMYPTLLSTIFVVF